MPGILTLPMPLALSLFAAADRTAPDIAELPRGVGPAVRIEAATQPGFRPGPAAGTPAPNKGAPAALPRISSRFGVRGDPFHRTARMHYGIDIPGRAGTPVRAAETGVVRFAGRAGSYGNLVEIAHGDGLATRYAHLSRMLVPAGTQVTRGDVIALMGSTGRSTGSHLHFELRAGGRAVDPLPHLGSAPLSRMSVAIAPVAPYRSAFARARDDLPEDRGPEL